MPVMRFDALRQPRAAVRIARVLWIAWAIVVWNVVFDHVIVVAGREYIAAADRAASSRTLPHLYENMDAWMRPAISRGLWIATAAAGVLLLTGLGLVRAARAPHTNR
jgi:hypothetical protein